MTIDWDAVADAEIEASAFKPNESADDLTDPQIDVSEEVEKWVREFAEE